MQQKVGVKRKMKSVQINPEIATWLLSMQVAKRLKPYPNILWDRRLFTVAPNIPRTIESATALLNWCAVEPQHQALTRVFRIWHAKADGFGASVEKAKNPSLHPLPRTACI